MIPRCWILLIYIIATFSLHSCLDKSALAKSSFKKTGKANPTSVISMGRDDDDGHAKKWHIGGSFE
jgi:hypothetical protein